MLRTQLAAALTVCLLPLSGCLESDGLEATQGDETSERAYLSSGCSRWRCGYNTAEIHGESLSQLHLGGKANADGVRIVGFISPLNLLGYKLAVEGDVLVAKGGLLLGNLHGVGLIGSTILIKLSSGLVVPVTLAGAEPVDSWAEGAAPITAYTLIYVDADNPLGHSNVCAGTLLDPLTAATTLIGGETYDDGTKTVEPNRSGWITLACPGSAVAKMKLMNYGPNSDFDGEGTPASVMSRQATLKMITADFCGTGDSYTTNGTPLHWANASGTVVPEADAEIGDFEAAWDGNGATCLDTPRHPELAEDLPCALPTCTAAHLDAAEWMTMNPAED